MLSKKNPLSFQFVTKLISLIVFCNLFLSACASDEKKTDTAEATFEVAQELEKNERFEEAIRKYSEVKNKFPYSSFATKAELAIADVYFKEESFGEAQINYQTFKELHPKHPQIDYVVFRIGLSFFNQLPETIDRDMTLAKDSIEAFDELIEKYPKSAHFAESKEKKVEALKKLAAKEDYIGDFYFKRKIYDSSLLRYEFLLKNYPKLGFDEKALARAYHSAKKVGDNVKSKNLFNRFKNEFPDSKELSKIEEMEKEQE